MAENLNLPENGKWEFLGKNEREEKLFYDKTSLKRKTPSKIELELLYLPSKDISKKCEDYWTNWFLMNEYREVMWIGIPEEEKLKCESLKYGIYKWQLNCKNKTYKELDYSWYNEKGEPVYTRKNTGISFLPIPKTLTENFPFEKFCQD